MEIDKNTPVNHSGSIEVHASAERIWSILSNIKMWPAWNPDIQWAKLKGPLKPGSKFVWKAGPGTVTSTLKAVEKNKLLAWSGKTLGIRAVHIWKLEAKGGSTIVTTEESWDGLLARLLKGYSRKTLAKATSSGLQSLKQAAEKA